MQNYAEEFVPGSDSFSIETVDIYTSYLRGVI